MSTRLQPMQPFLRKTSPASGRPAFTLVEMLVVIAVISILMTAGILGLNGIGGKGVTSGVATAETVFNEARTTAMGRGLRSCVLVGLNLTGNGGSAYASEHLRRLVVAYEQTDTNTSSSTYGQALNPTNANPKWVLSSREVLLPDQTFFSKTYSVLNQQTGVGAIPTITDAQLINTQGGTVQDAYKGTYCIYVFNSQGICSTPGASFVIGSGARDPSKSGITAPPHVKASAKHDFGGFVIWRDGNTSVFHSPAQINTSILTLTAGATF